MWPWHALSSMLLTTTFKFVIINHKIKNLFLVLAKNTPAQDNQHTQCHTITITVYCMFSYDNIIIIVILSLAK